jgi:uncharacterized protein Usg
MCSAQTEKPAAFEGFTLTTAEILYHLPDHPGILQSYVWQGHDRAPNFPVLNRFLDFWRRELDGPLHSVRIASRDTYAPAEVSFVECGYTIH